MSETSSMLRSVPLSRPFSAAGGHAFIAAIPAEVLPGLAAGQLAIVAENGNLLGPAGTLHQHIREQGRGAFSVWGSHVYLSASDSSDCNTNGRAYSLVFVDLADASLRDELARNDALLLDLLHRNRQHNNSLVANFFGYYQVVSSHLQRHGIAMPRRALELGTGKRPYTGLRFLAEGVELFVANDVQRIERTLPAAYAQQLVDLLGLIDSASAERLRSRVEAGPGPNEVRVRGLEVADERPFEELEGPRDLDLIFSTSVLEHVQKPREVVARMHELLRSGGHAWHGIDLRDHRDFAKPLDFLRMTAADYAAIDTENRLRASDWLQLFGEAGFEIVARQYATIPAGSQDGSNLRLVHQAEPPTQPWVDATMRAGFAPPFAAGDLVDLSILGITLLCRKP